VKGWSGPLPTVTEMVLSIDAPRGRHHYLVRSNAGTLWSLEPLYPHADVRFVGTPGRDD
jgi:hypothetical protein